MQAKKAVKQKKKVVHLDSDADDMSMDDDEEDSDFDGAPKKVRLPGRTQSTGYPVVGSASLQHQSYLQHCHSLA